MPEPAFEGHHAGKIFYRHRKVFSQGGAVPQAAVAVVSPGPDRAIFLQGQRMIIAGPDGDDAAEVFYLHRNGPIYRGAISELAVAVPTPRPDGAVVFQCEGVIDAA